VEMRVIAVFFGPCAPAVRISYVSVFSHDFKRLGRLTKLATSSRGDGIGYSGYKHQKGEKVIAITDNHGYVLAPLPVAPVHEADMVLLPKGLKANWLQGLGTTETPHIEPGVRHQFHPVVALREVLETEEQPRAFVFPRKRPLDPLP
jgi:hypothetical protein